MFSIISWTLTAIGLLAIFALIAVPDSQAIIHNCNYSLSLGRTKGWGCMSDGLHFASVVGLLILVYINLFSRKLGLDKDEEMHIKFIIDAMLGISVVTRTLYLYQNHANYIYALWTTLIFIICVVRFYELHYKVYSWFKN